MTTELTSKAIAVEVPEGAKGFFVHDGKIWTDETYRGIFSKKLPPGSWSILGRPEEMTREQCDKVMEGYDGSLYTLLPEKNIKPEDSVIILIKQ